MHKKLGAAYNVKIGLQVAEAAHTSPEALQLATLLAAAVSIETPFVQADSFQARSLAKLVAAAFTAKVYFKPSMQAASSVKR